jgi:hypothetical protein
VKNQLSYISGMLLIVFLASISATASDRHHNGNTLVLTSTNDPSANQVVVFRLNSEGTPSLTLVNTLPTGGKGGAGGNAGAAEFRDAGGAVVNYGSNTVSRIIRDEGSVRIAGTISLAPNCAQPVSVALRARHAFVVGSNCAESHSWPSGYLDGNTVSLPDNSAAQIVTGRVDRRLRSNQARCSCLGFPRVAR